MKIKVRPAPRASRPPAGRRCRGLSHQQLVEVDMLALLLPHPAQALRRPPLLGVDLLMADKGEGLLKAGVDLCHL
jgi:hypothetical protein